MQTQIPSSNSPTSVATFGHRLKQWRQRRGLSQLELALQANTSQRYISFIETGRARPGADVIERLNNTLDLPLRERNKLYEAAGLPTRYTEAALSTATAAPFRNAVSHMLRMQEPYPAYVLDRWWTLVEANQAASRLFPVDEGANLVDIFLQPGPIRQMVANFGSVAWDFLHRLRAEAQDAGPDERLEQLIVRAENFLADVPMPATDHDVTQLAICPILDFGDNRLVRTVSVIARFGHVRDVLLDELRVELLFPADAEADAFFHEVAQSSI